MTVNVLEIDIKSAVLEYRGASEEPTNISYDKDFQSVKFEFASTLQAGMEAKLTIKFTGKHNDDLAGFYRSKFVDENGKETYYVTSQMEATDCRRAFPCFDEPALKASFAITMITDQESTALSNMDVKEVKIVNGKKVTVFNKTPPMSTYLVALVVGPFKYIESKVPFRIPVRVYAVSGTEMKKMQYAADFGAKVLDFFEKKFDIPYPLPKLDMIGIHDFSSSAMENWGLVTYRAVDLLYDEVTDSINTKLRVTEVVAHELAHQWFGNLVTMQFWDGLWLNEGFATWMSYYATDYYFPDWKIWESYIGGDFQLCLSLDSMRSSHPIHVPVKRADEINQIFDAISYQKGSSVIRMISKFLSEDIMIRAVSKYLKTHAYGNTETSDLWAAMTEVSGKDIVSLMDTWTNKVGFPLLTVNEDKKQITVRQNRFLITGDVQVEDDQVLYPVNLELKTRGKIDDSLMLTDREMTFTLPTDDDFYQLNANYSGLYRVLYPTDRVKKLADAGTEGLLSVEGRVGLIADSGALSTSGYQNTSDLLTLIAGWNRLLTNSLVRNVEKFVYTRSNLAI